MGLACPVKAVAGNSFSLLIFGFTQIAMDIQPLVHLLRGEGVMHGISHSYLGATVIGVVAVVVGRPICNLILRTWKPEPEHRFENWLRGADIISWRAAIFTAFLGTYSHVLIDSMIHGDVLPFAPFSAYNPLLGTVSFDAMHMICVGTGLLGIIGWLVVYAVETRAKS
jgi:hypothetical protein